MKDLGVLQQDPEVVVCVNQKRSHGTNQDWIWLSPLELVKTQTVKANQALIRPNPKIAIGCLCDGGYRSAWPAFLSAPRVVEILRHGPGWVDRGCRNSEADNRESGNGAPE
jgi:hypothetical protein